MNAIRETMERRRAGCGFLGGDVETLPALAGRDRAVRVGAGEAGPHPDLHAGPRTDPLAGHCAEGTYRIDTPFGALRATLASGRLYALVFGDGRSASSPEATARPTLVATLAAQVREWASGRRATFDLPFAERGTAFQRAVWAAVREVPPGSVTSYAALARTLGRPRSARAVGAALAANPWLLVVPCHRVVAVGGALTGYAGGLARKRALLAFEREKFPAADR